MKAIIFARGKKRDANAAQLSRIAKYSAAKGLIAWKTYTVEASSTHAGWETFQEVLNTIRDAREPLALIVDSVDRLPRSVHESVLLDELRRAGKLEIHFCRESLIIGEHSGHAEFLRWDMAVMLARSYARWSVECAKRKRAQLLRRGGWPHPPPFGYASIPDAHGGYAAIVPDPWEGRFVRKMFQINGGGKSSLRTLADRLYGEGLRSVAGKRIPSAAIGRMLRNPFYYGQMQANGTRFPHRCKRLITKRLFDKCQKIRKSRNRKTHPPLPDSI